MKTLGRIILVLGLVGLLVTFIRWQFRDFSWTHCAQVQQYFLQMGWTAPLLIFIGFVSASFALMPSTLLALLTGLIYGWGWGTALALSGIASGACLAFFISRTLARQPLEQRLRHRSWYIRLQSMLQGNELGFVVLVRLVPLFPFTGLNFACGLLPIRFVDFALGSLLGMLPGTFVYVYLGHTGCQLIEPMMLGKFRDVHIPIELRWQLGSALFFLLLLSSTPILWQLRNRRKR
ncbi:MAG TPA: TVP38/TMEM64 family protein [Oligoflexus sp.]|uniref:TVP38/TMEM64 family protein n=1 Tax=Oligoflexus sp. TaxID=1971216 RepID=UPI002D4FE8B0|nr:TVP38/TMEM64 family protein [Oligoflexus sp.]HYX33008.1 TVP38/TMEM64 family protein [Oligoflexus sp.]